MVMPAVADALRDDATDDRERDDSIDRQLVRRSQAGDRDAFAALYRRHVLAVHAFAYRLSGSREVADDVTSATFEKAFTSLHAFSWRGGGIRPWLYRIASNETSLWYRREQRWTKPRAQMILRELALGTEGAEDPEPIFGVDPTALRSALATLRPNHRDAITLRYLAALSTDEAAAAMGCTKAALAVTLHRAVNALRSALTDAPSRAGGS